MSRRWTRWIRAWTWFSIIWIGPALLWWPAPTLLAIAVPPASAAAVAWFVHRSGGTAARADDHARGHECLWLAALAGSTVIASLCLGKVSAGIPFLLMAVAVLTSPPGRDHLASARGSRRSEGRERAPHPVLDGTHDDEVFRSIVRSTVDDMSDAALCIAWRRSFQALHEASSSSAVGRVVEVRQLYLDTMERRNAAALCAWLESGARASGGPDRYLIGRHDERGRPEPA